MWSRGDVLEAIRWVKRASESAADAGADDRAFALARAAADLKMASGTVSITPNPPDVQAALPVIPAPPPPLASPQRPAAFAPPSRPPSVLPGPPRGPTPPLTSLAQIDMTDKRRAKVGATTLQSAGLPSPRPKPATPSVFPLPASSGGPLQVPAQHSRTQSPSGVASQRHGTLVMAGTPAPPSTMPPTRSAPPSFPSPSDDPEEGDDGVGETTIVTQGGGDAARRGASGTARPPALIEDIPTMARTQPFELTGAVDPGTPLAPHRPTSPTAATSQPAGSSAPAQVAPVAASVPAAKVWIYRVNGIIRVLPLSAPKPDGAAMVVLLSTDGGFDLSELLRG